jgi:hypothetical protein
LEVSQKVSLVSVGAGLEGRGDEADTFPQKNSHVELSLSTREQTIGDPSAICAQQLQSGLHIRWTHTVKNRVEAPFAPSLLY